MIIAYFKGIYNKDGKIMAKIGETYELVKTVEKEHLASSMRSGCLGVLATPMVVAYMEEAALEMLEKDLPQGITTVGTYIAVEHLSPTPAGAEVRAVAVLSASDGRFFEFDVQAYDKAGLIARGKHTRASVKAEKFQIKADSKFDEI